MKPAWKGPIEGGITQSLIGNFLGNPYAAFIYYGLGLEEPSELEPNLHWGNGMHLALESFLPRNIPTKWITEDIEQEIFNLVKTFFQETYPKFPSTFPHSITRMLKLYDNAYCIDKEIQTELKFAKPYTTPKGLKCTLRGKCDVLCPTEFIGEHKCKGKVDTAQTREETPVDLQSLLYCWAFGVKKVIYDLIRIPESEYWQPTVPALATPAGKVKMWFENCQSYKDWPIAPNKHLWLSQLEIDIPEENIESMFKFTLDPIIEYIWAMYDLWCEPSFDPENPDCYGPLFYRTPIRQFDATKTERYKCRYHSIFSNQATFEELIPVTSFYKELEDGTSGT